MCKSMVANVDGGQMFDFLVILDTDFDFINTISGNVLCLDEDCYGQEKRTYSRDYKS